MTALDTATLIAREYLRVSKDKSGRERSPQEQHADNEKAATFRRWRLGQSYKDLVSASRYATKAREGFPKLIADLQGNKFGAQVLIMWESSRGSRRVGEWVSLIDLCELRKVLIYVTSDNKLYDPADPRDRRSLLEDAIDAEYEVSKTSKRVRRAKAASAAEGKPAGPVPFGYKRFFHPATKQFVSQEPEPDEAKIIKELFDRLEGGNSLRSLEIEFERRGIRSRTGRVFSAQHLRSLALTHTYAGLRVYDPARPRNSRSKLTPTALVTEGQWPGIVSKAQFYGVYRLLTAPERLTTRPGRAVHLLTMIARCDVCGGPLTRNLKNSRETYVCWHGSHVRVGYDDLNTFGENLILEYLSRADQPDALTADRDGGEEISAARDAVAQIRAELDELGDQVGRGEMSPGLAARAEPGILKRLREAEQRERELSTPSALRGLIEPGEQVAKRWAAAPMAVKRQIARIVLAPGYLGQLRVTRSPVRNTPQPVHLRVTLSQTPQE